MSYKNLRVVMLGHSGAGKTSYMASAYYRLHSGIFGGRKDVDGFGIKCLNPVDHSRLRELGKRISNGIFPLGTDQRSEYLFQMDFKKFGFGFMAARHELSQFVWADYRGGALEEDTTNSSQARALLQDLNTADAIILFIDSCTLTDGHSSPGRQLVKRLTNLLGNALQQRTSHFSVVIALTKADLTNVSEKNLPAVLSPLLEALAGSTCSVSTVVPTSCVNECQHIEIPILSVLSWWVIFEMYDVRCELEQLKAQISVAKKQIEDRDAMASKYIGFAGLGNSLKCAFTGEESHAAFLKRKKKELERLKMNATKRRESMKPLYAPAKAVREMIESRGLLIYGKHPALSSNTK